MLLVMRRSFQLLVCIFLSWTPALSIAQARDYYVSPTGDDANSGTLAEPWRSVAKVNGTRLRPGDCVHFRGGGSFAGTYTAIQYTDWVTPESAACLAGYADQWHLRPFAAVTRNTYGKGQGWYVGAVVKESAFYDNLAAQLLKDAGIRPVMTPPPGVEVSIREKPGKRFLFLINHAEEPKTVRVPKDKVELLTGQKMKESLDLDRFGVAVIEL